jgi:hypothetical protein
MSDHMGRVLDELLKKKYGNLGLDEIMEKLDVAVDRLLSEVFFWLIFQVFFARFFSPLIFFKFLSDKKPDAKKITNQLLKEIKELGLKLDEEKLEQAVSSMVTKKIEQKFK